MPLSRQHLKPQHKSIAPRVVLKIRFIRVIHG
jgi:hypothetical protein